MSQIGTTLLSYIVYYKGPETENRGEVETPYVLYPDDGDGPNDELWVRVACGAL
jgi:hypothetical protein